MAEQAGHPVEHLDLNGVSNYLDAVVDHAARTEAFQFCLTATTPQMPAAGNIARSLRSALPECRIILGGPHPTVTVAAMRKEFKRGQHKGRAHQGVLSMMETFDSIVAGDGELVIGDLLESRSNFLIDADNPASSGFMSSTVWAGTALPARHLIDMDSYHYKIDGKRVTTIVSQLGCPMACNFCSGRSSGMLRRMRTRPVEDVLSEMRYVIEAYGVEGFMFFDDELNINKEMLPLMKGIKELQKKLGLELANRGFVKAELFNLEQAEAMREAGFRQVLCGFESGSERILRNIRKNATIEDNTGMLLDARSAGMEVKALMSLGHPGESRETIQDTVSWLLEMKVDDFDCTIITAYPGSPYFDDAVKVSDETFGGVWQFETNGDRLYMYEVDYSKVADYYKGQIGEYKSYVFTDDLSSEALVRLRDEAELVVRKTLGIKFNPSQASRVFESSMGMLPSSVYRRSDQ